MRNILVCLLLISCLIIPVSASMNDECTGTVDIMQRSLPTTVRRIINDFDPSDPDDMNNTMRNIILSAIEESFHIIRDVLNMIVRVLVIVILCNMVSCSSEGRIQKVTLISGVISLMLVCAADVNSMIATARSTISHIDVFASSMLPIMASAAASTGAANSGAALYTVTVIFSRLLINICNKCIVPMIYMVLGLSISGAILETDRLKNLRDLLSELIRKGLKWIMYLFTGFLSISGVLAGSADAMTLKAVKMAISGMVPVVGSIVSEAADTVLTGAELLKSTAGTFGMIGILAIFLMPFMKIGIWFLGFRLSTALSSVIESKLSGCIDTVSQTMGFIMAMVGSCSLMNLLGCLSFMKMVIS